MAGEQTWNWGRSKTWPGPADDMLERALVAGLMLDAVLKAPALPLDPQIRRRHLKLSLTRSLVRHLSGRITLDRFRTLVDRLEDWFLFYYPLMPPRPASGEGQEGGARAAAPPATCRPHPLLRHDRLRAWLATAGPGILPQRPQRKIQPARLEEFFVATRGLWFRVKDLARTFDLDRKTAWEYLQKLQTAGLLVHNDGRSAAVRYRLADRFLTVGLAALQQQVAQTLAALPPAFAARVAAWLAATAGAPFWEDSWPPPLAAGRREEVINSLKTAAVLEGVFQSGRQRMLRLARRWLDSPAEGI